MNAPRRAPSRPVPLRFSNRFRPCLESLESRWNPANVFLKFEGGLNDAVIARIKVVMQAEFDDAGADIHVTDDPAGAARTVCFVNDFSPNDGLGSRWGDSGNGVVAKVYVKEFTSDAAVSGSFNTDTKLGNAVGETAAHEIGHTYGCDHNHNEPNDKMTDGGDVTPDERAADNRMFSEADKVKLRKNAGVAAPPAPVIEKAGTIIQVVVPSVPTVPPPSKAEDFPFINAELQFGGSLCNFFHLGYFVDTPNGPEFFTRTSLNFPVSSEAITLFNGDAMQWVIAGEPGTPFTGQVFTSNDAMQFDLSDPISNSQLGKQVFRKLTMSWDVNNDSIADVFVTLDTDALHPGSTNGFLNPSFAELRPIVTGTGPGGGALVKLFDPETFAVRRQFLAYDISFRGGVQVATGDVNGDGIPDIITAAGAGGGPHVRVFDGATFAEIRSFFAFASTFTGGLTLASGDVNGDGRADMIIGAGPGGAPHVKVIDGRTGSELQSFFAYGLTYLGGVRVGSGDVNGDGHDDVIVGTGPGAAPHVGVFSGGDSVQLRSFFAYAQTFTSGLYVAGGDLTADGRADIIVGTASGAPHVKAFNSSNGGELASFFAYPQSFLGGVRVGASDVDGDGRDDIITGTGPGAGPHVKAFGSVTKNEIGSFFAYEATFTGGIFVGG